MNDLSTLKAHLDAAWEEIQDSALSRELARKEQRAWDANKPVSRPYLRLEKLHAAIAETAALLADDDIQEMTATIANEKGRKMNAEDLAKAMYLDKLATVYQLPDDSADDVREALGL